MLVNIHHDSRREHNRLLVAGVVFLTVIALLIGFSIAVYQKKFDRVTMVTIQADRAGLQLARFGDVRINGVLVGQVRVGRARTASRRSSRSPSSRTPPTRSPTNVGVQIIPTTLFGQKFISFVRPATTRPARSQDGDVIPADRVETNVELSKILADLFPLLRAVQPAELNYTLNALATALEGRGEQLGETLDQLDAYLGAISDKLPTLKQDLISLANVADTYDLAAPDLIDGARQPHGDQQDDHREGRRPRQLLLRPPGAGGHLDAGAVGQQEEPDPGRPGHRAGAQAAGGLLAGVPLPDRGRRQVRTAPGHRPSRATRSSSTSSSAPPSTSAYHADDRPLYGEVGHGPWCDGLPEPQGPGGPDGVRRGLGHRREPAHRRPAHPDQRRCPAQRAATADATTSGYAGTDAEKAIINALLAGETGRAADSYGALGSLLYGPVVRGGDGS